MLEGIARQQMQRQESQMETDALCKHQDVQVSHVKTFMFDIFGMQLRVCHGFQSLITVARADDKMSPPTLRIHTNYILTASVMCLYYLLGFQYLQ